MPVERDERTYPGLNRNEPPPLQFTQRLTHRASGDVEFFRQPVFPVEPLAGANLATTNPGGELLDNVLAFAEYLTSHVYTCTVLYIPLSSLSMAPPLGRFVLAAVAILRHAFR